MNACRRSVFVFAKEPRSGQVKTRLAPPLTLDQAVRCHRAFVTDTVARLSPGAGADARLVLAASPAGPKPWLAALAADNGIELVEQGRGDLGARMARVLQGASGPGRACVLVGADTPDLPAALVREAFAALERPGVVLGPATDGGYYLVGVSGTVPPIFALKTAWGGSAVLVETLAHLKASAVDYELLPEWSDVDRYADLQALARRLRLRGVRGAAATARLLAELADEGLQI